MKKNKHLLIVIATLLCSIAANATTGPVQIEGIWYNLVTENKQASVTRNTDQTKLKYKGDIVIPSSVTYGGVSYDVTEIGDYAFFSCADLASISIPRSVIKIGIGAFEECRNLPAISLPEKLESIEKYAFAGCSSIDSIAIPATVTWVGEGSFWDCKSLKTLVVEDADVVLCLGANFHNKISEGMFNDCPLEKIYLGRDLSYPESELYGYSPFYNKSELASLTLGDKVTMIGENLLANCSSVASIELPSNVVAIGNSAFMGCSSLATMVIPAGINSISEGTFMDCASLTSVIIPANVAQIGKNAFAGCGKLDFVKISSLEAWCKINFESSSANPLSFAKKLYLNDNLVTEISFPNTITKINDFTFCNYSEALVSVTIPEGVVSIGDSAFYNCANLATINVPNSVELIGCNAFENCTGELLVDCDIPAAVSDSEGAFYKARFSNVTISDKVAEIGDYAFYGCGNLKSLSIAESVKSIGVGAFNGCTGELLLSCNVPSSLSAAKSGFYKNVFSKVTVDDKVKEIGDYAFYGSTKLDTITIEKNVEKIGKYAFVNSTGTLEFDCNISSAASDTLGAFYKSAFTKVVVGENVDSIGGYAFSTNEALASISIPSSFESIGENAFKGCKKLSDIHIGDLQSWLTIKCANKDARPNTQTKAKLYVNNAVLSKAEVPVTIDSIPDYAFYNCTLDSVALPQTIVAIGNNAFANCTGKLAVNCNIPSAAKAGDGAFYGSAFEKVIVGETVDSIGAFAFANNSKLASISLPVGLDSIGADAFKNNKALVDIYLGSLESWLNLKFGNKDAHPNTLGEKANLYVGNAPLVKIEIPSTVSAIPDYAFFNCKFESIVLPESIVAFGSRAFENCSGKLAVNCNIPAATTAEGGAFYKSLLTEVTFGNQVKSIGSYAFANCGKMVSMSLPAGITSMGGSAFEGCTGALVVNCNVPSVSASSEGAFYKSKFSKLAIGNQVDSIGSFAFADCANLQDISLSASLDSIGANAFNNSKKIANVYVEDLESWLAIECANKESRPNTLNKSVKIYVDSTLLTDVVMPVIVDSIAAYAFCNCADLISVTIPEAVKAIGEEAFNGCTKLYKVFNNSALELVEGKKDYGYVAFYAKSVIELDKVDLKGDFQFKTIDDVHYLVNYVGENSEVELPANYNGKTYHIAAAAFYNCDSIKAVVIPAGVETIGEGAFNGCDNLASVKLAKEVASIDNDAFKGCNKLSNVYVETLDSWLALECANKESRPNSNGKTKLYVADELLKEIKLSSDITSIPDYAFFNCDSIVTVTIPALVEKIGAYAFAGCSSIASITCSAEEAPTCGAKAFDGVSKAIPVYVVTEANVYTGAEGWKEFSNIIGKDTGVEIVEGGNQQTIIYDLQGRRVENPTNGIYIINGKKVYFHR